MGSQNSENFKDLGGILIVIAVISLLIGCIVHEKISGNYDDKDRYEITVVSKYSDLSSNWHPIGGRASETRYMVYAEIRQTYSSSGGKLRHYRKDYEIDGTAYNMAVIGKKYISKKDIIMDSDMNNLLK